MHTHCSYYAETEGEEKRAGNRESIFTVPPDGGEIQGPEIAGAAVVTAADRLEV